ncbi:MAG: urease accessory protein UreF [Alphaproteobacteria bacterium]
MTTATTIITTTTIRTRMTMTTNTEGLYRLFAWLSPAYPIGAFSYSHGIEYAVEAELVHDRASLVGWCAHILRRGAAWTDAVLLAHAVDAARARDFAQLDRLADLAAAWRGTAETALESVQQGSAFVSTTRAAWADAVLELFARQRGEKPIALPIALGVAAASQVEKSVVVAAYLQSFAANLVSAAVRLVPLGQKDGQLAIAELAAVVSKTTTAAMATALDDCGTAAPMVDWTSAKHETQYTRLFRS